MKRLGFTLLLGLTLLSHSAGASIIIVQPFLGDDTAFLPLPSLENLLQANPFEGVVGRPDGQTVSLSSADELQYDDSEYPYYSEDWEEGPSLGVSGQWTTLLQMTRTLVEQGQTAYQAGRNWLTVVDAAIAEARYASYASAFHNDDEAAIDIEGCPAEEKYAAEADLFELEAEAFAESDYSDIEAEIFAMADLFQLDANADFAEAEPAPKYGDDKAVALWCCVSGDEYRYWTNVEEPKADSAWAGRLTDWAGRSLVNWNTAISNILRQIALPDWKNLVGVPNDDEAAPDALYGYGEEDFVNP